MAKYSTGGSSGGDGGDACELCGASSDSLRTATVAGATLSVCPDCAPHGDTPDDDGGSEGGPSDDERRQRAVRNAARANDVWDGDSSRWEEEGTDYEADRLPYLVRDYDERLVRARQSAGLQREELAAAVDAPEADLLALEQGRATQAGVGGSLVRAVEDRLDVELTE